MAKYVWRLTDTQWSLFHVLKGQARRALLARNYERLAEVYERIRSMEGFPLDVDPKHDVIILERRSRPAKVAATSQGG